MSLVPSALNLFTGSGFQKLIQKTGAESKAVVRVAGEEMRATIDKAEDAAKRTLTKMGSEVRTSIDKAQESTVQVLQTASSEMNKLIGMTGIEARYTSKVMELQVEKALGKAGREADILFKKAGIEVSQAIRLNGAEIRASSIQFNQGINENIKLAREETSLLLTQGGVEVKDILTQASFAAKEVLHTAGDEYAYHCRSIIEKAMDNAKEAMSKTVELANIKLAGRIEQIAKEANGLILNMGKQGRLLIKDTGTEIRVVGNELLSKAFAGQEMVIQVAGEESRLTVQALGKELRSTIYEIPSVAAIGAEQVGRNFAFGLKDGFFGVSEVNTLINRMKNLRGSSNALTIQDLLKFIDDQVQLNAKNKSLLYMEAINLFNEPTYKDRDTIFLFIGVAVLKDQGLIAPSGLWFGDWDYRTDILEKIPGNIRERLAREENPCNLLLPRSVDEEVGEIAEDPLLENEMQLEAQRLVVESFQMALQNSQEETGLLAVLFEEEQKMRLQKESEGQVQDRKIKELAEKVLSLEKLIEQHKNEIQFLDKSITLIQQ